MPWQDFFRKALTIHVNLSVLVWMVSFLCLLWVAFGNVRDNFLDKAALIFCIFGTIIFSISPFLGSGEALLNNYVPIFDNKIFLIGISIFAGGAILQLFLLLVRLIMRRNPFSSDIEFGVYSSSLIVAMAVLCLFWSFLKLSAENGAEVLTRQGYFEILFWGGGHVLQLAYTQLTLIAWLWLSSALGLNLTSKKWVKPLLLSLGVIMAIPSPYVYFRYEITDPFYIEFFSKQMQHGAGIAAGIFSVLVIFAFLRKKQKTTLIPERNCLLWSIALFGIGDILGFLISGINVTIPAHYHGSIVGVTLALMGLTYNLLPRLGFSDAPIRISSIQPHIYGIGQLMHIIGLAWSGGYGVLRKTPGAMETIEAKISMGLMGAGGMLAIIGGLLFVIAAFTSVTKSPIRRS